MKTNLNSSLLLWTIAFATVYLLTLPSGWMISDSYSYFNQGKAIAGGSYSYSLTDPIDGSFYPMWGTAYSLGAAHWLAIFIGLFGTKGAFIASMIASIIAAIITSKTIKKLAYSQLGVVLLLCFLPFQFFAKTLMSGLPSLALSAVFAYGLMTLKDGRKKWFLLCALASFSFWFRESNLLLLGLICFIHWAIDRRYFFHYAAGAIIGLLPRLASAYFAYGDPFYFVLAEPFTLSALMHNFWIYGVLALIFIPGGLFFLYMYRGRYRWEIIISVTAFLIFYTGYSYTAVPYSGPTRGLLLTGRFILPALPFFAIAAGYFFNKYKWNIPNLYLWSFLSVVTIICQLGVNTVTSREKATTTQLQEIISEEDFLFYDLSRLTNILRYINPMTLDHPLQSDIKNVASAEYMTEFFQHYDKAKVALTIGVGNEEKKRRTNKIKAYLSEAQKNHTLTKVKTIVIESDLSIEVYELTK